MGGTKGGKWGGGEWRGCLASVRSRCSPWDKKKHVENGVVSWGIWGSVLRAGVTKPLHARIRNCYPQSTYRILFNVSYAYRPRAGEKKQLRDGKSQALPICFIIFLIVLVVIVDYQLEVELKELKERYHKDTAQWDSHMLTSFWENIWEK